MVTPLSKQIEIAYKRLQTASEPCIVISHSQGCIAAAYALTKPDLNVAQIILIAPPSGGSSERFISYLETLPGAHIKRYKESVVPMPTGKRGLIPASCFDDMDRLYPDVKQIYQELPYRLNIIRTNTDETLGPANDYSGTDLHITTILNANHDFSVSNSRQELLETIKNVLSGMR